MYGHHSICIVLNNVMDTKTAIRRTEHAKSLQIETKSMFED
jgi:hypothetical protein